MEKMPDGHDGHDSGSHMNEKDLPVVVSWGVKKLQMPWVYVV